jgi:hypothetical protein
MGMSRSEYGWKKEEENKGLVKRGNRYECGLQAWQAYPAGSLREFPRFHSPLNDASMACIVSK